MEKRRAHHPLSACHTLLHAGAYRITHSSLAGAFEMDMFVEDILKVVEHLSPLQLYKSMTTHHDHTRWQDVYHCHHKGYELYVKLSVDDGVCLIVVSFKER